MTIFQQTVTSHHLLFTLFALSLGLPTIVNAATNTTGQESNNLAEAKVTSSESLF